MSSGAEPGFIPVPPDQPAASPRAKTRRRRHSGSRLPATPAQSVFLFLLIVTPLLFGSVYPWALALMAILLSATAAMLLWSPGWSRERGLAGGCWPLLALAFFLAWAGAQIMPLPAAWLESLAPERYRLWTLPAQLGLEDIPATLTLSLFPHGTYQGLAKFGLYCLGAATCLVLCLRVDDHPASSFPATIARCLWASGLVISLVAIVQVSFGAQAIYGFWKPFQSNKFMGPYVNRNHFAGYLEMALPMALAWLGLLVRRAVVYNPDRSKRQKDNPHNFQVAMVALGAFFMLLALGLSLSRSGIVFGLAVLEIQALVLLFLVKRRSLGRLPRLVMGLGMVMVIVLALTTDWEALAGRFGQVFSLSLDDDIRGTLYRDTWRMAGVFPWLGWGLGSYIHTFPQFKTSPVQALFDHAHNDYLELLAETGWIGLGALVVFIAAALWAGARPILLALRQGRQCPDPLRQRAILATGALGGVAAMLLHSLTDFNLQIPANGLLFFVLCATCLALGRKTG